MLKPCLPLVTILLSAAPALAVTGTSVTVHWAGVNDNYWGGYGAIWRHDLVDSKVVKHEKIFDGQARIAMLSPDGTEVAFIDKDGQVCKMGVTGGEVTVLATVEESTAHLDWPQPDWIFFNHGGLWRPDLSRTISAVSAKTGITRHIVDLDKGLWSFSIAADLQRAVVRTDDFPFGLYQRIVAYDLSSGSGVLQEDRALPWPSCSEGIDPQGEFIMQGWATDHLGLDIMRWDDLSKVTGFSHQEALAWGGPDSGTGHNHNNWSTNSSKWILIHLGWGWRGDTGANQVLYNWADKERIVVTENTEGSHLFDSAGDLFVSGEVAGQGPPVVRFQPQPIQAKPGEQAVFSVIAAGAPPLSYQWQRRSSSCDDWSDIPGETVVTYGLSSIRLEDHHLELRCLISNGQGSTYSQSARIDVEGGSARPPYVEIAPVAPGYLNQPLVLEGHGCAEGYSPDELSYVWSKVSGPGEVAFASPDRPSSSARFLVAGDYVLALTVSDGKLSGQASVTVQLSEPTGCSSFPLGSAAAAPWSLLLVLAGLLVLAMARRGGTMRNRGKSLLSAVGLVVIVLTWGCGETGHGGLDATPTAGELHGTVRDAVQKPLAGATVKVGAQTVSTDAKGTFSLSGLAVGTVTLEVSAEWHQDKQQAASIVGGQLTTVEIGLEQLPLRAEPDDLDLLSRFNKTFDWSRDKVSIVLVHPTRREVDNAIYLHNPAFFVSTSGMATITPNPMPRIDQAGGHDFDFTVQSGPNKGTQALLAATIVGAEAQVPAAVTAEPLVMWDAAISFLQMWDPAKSANLYMVGNAVRGQSWGATPPITVQHIEKVFVHEGEVWVQVVFENILQLGAEVKDCGDGRKAIYGKLDPIHYTKELLDKLAGDYRATLTTLQLRDVVSDAASLLYSKTSPVIASPIGKPFEIPDWGTVKYPFVVVTHLSNKVNNVLLATP